MIWVERDSGYEQSWSRKRVWLAQNSENAGRIKREIERESEKVKWGIITHTVSKGTRLLSSWFGCFGFAFGFYFLGLCIFSKKRKQI